MRKILLSVLAFFAVGIANAEEKTLYLKTDTQVLIPVENVDYLLAADADNVFTVVVREGESVANVTSVKVVDSTTGVRTVADNAKASVELPTKASSVLRLTGLAVGSRVEVYSTDGTLVRQATANGGDLTIGVADMPNGTYVLKTGDSRVKFVKH